MRVHNENNSSVCGMCKKLIIIIAVTLLIIATVVALLVTGDTMQVKNAINVSIIGVLILVVEVCVFKLKKTNYEYNQNQQGYILSIEAMNGAVWAWDDKSKKISISNKVRNLVGIDKDRLTLEEWYEFVFEPDKARVKEYLNDICSNKKCILADIKYSIKGVQGDVIHLHYNGKGIIKDNTYHLSGVVTDITNETNNEMKIHFMSYYDNITGIPNRKMFSEKFQNLINESLKNKTKLALIFFDIDNFKNINDTYGHEVGDEVLLKICKRVYDLLDDGHTFARFGGDEFVIAMSKIEGEDDVKKFLEDLLEEIRKPFDIDGKKIYCSISLGVSIYPRDAEGLSLLLKTADMSMHTAKAEGKNRYKFFDVDISKLLKRQYEIEKALRGAIDKNELYMVFQPKISIKGEKINGFEALVRWNSSELGFISPGEFIPIAESSGIIIDLGKFVIEESFKKCKELLEISNKKFHIAINISDIQLREDGFIEYVADLLKEYEIPASYIEFEITEGIIMESVERNIETLLSLKELGLSIALDDFGTGYSSLSYLKRLPIDVLKIDKSFVDGIGVDEKSEYIAESIIKLSHNLDLKVVAEGVETKEQLGYLDKMKCDIAQGYYFSKPEEFENIKKMI